MGLRGLGRSLRCSEEGSESLLRPFGFELFCFVDSVRSAGAGLEKGAIILGGFVPHPGAIRLAALIVARLIE